MKIKLIAVDMDGTFLHSDMSYDRELFKELFIKMRNRGIHFVVASGNQYYQIKSFFGEMQDDITYVSENGALIFDNKENIFKVKIPKETVKEITDVLNANSSIISCVCGVKNAYILKGKPETKKMVSLYFHRLIECDNFDEIDDEIVKFSLFVPEEQRNRIAEELKEKIGHLINPVTSGNIFIDLIIPEYNKGTAIKILCQRWGISLDECMAFGDSLNDLEMLENVKYSYAMKNADKKIKEIAAYETLSNDENGVLKVIKDYLEG